MEIQLFAKDRWSIGRPIIAEQAPWFKGNDAAASLEYGNVCPTDTPSNKQPHEVYINESGLYNLAKQPSKPEAKPFKRWVTSEVLPAIQKMGTMAAAT